MNRPGLEMMRPTPSNVEELLFDEIIWVQRAGGARRLHAAAPRQVYPFPGDPAVIHLDPRRAHRWHAWHRPSTCFARLTRKHQSPPRQRGLLYFYKRHLGVFRFRQGRQPKRWPADLNHHPRFNLFQRLAAGIRTKVQIVLDVLGVGSPADG